MRAQEVAMMGFRSGWKLVAFAAALLAAVATSPPAAARRPQPRWLRIGPVAAWVNALAVTYGPGRVLAATADAGIFRSDDAGSSWVASGAGLPAAAVFDAAAAPADARTA